MLSTPFRRSANLAILVFAVALAGCSSSPSGLPHSCNSSGLLASGSDPNFASVSSLYPEMESPREVIGVKNHRDEFIIMPDGRVNFTPVRAEDPLVRRAENMGHAFFSLGDGDTWLGKSGSDTRAVKRLLEGYMPIVIADFQQAGQSEPGLTFEQTAVAWSDGMSADEPLWAFVQLKVSNSGDRSREVRLGWYVDHVLEVPKDRKVRTIAVWQLELEPGAEQIVYGKLPFLDGYEMAVECSAEEFENRLGEASAFWKHLLNEGISINVPEQRVNDAYRAWLAYTFLNVDKIGDQYEPHDGSGFYEAVYGIMAAKYCNALGMMGYPDEARTYLDSLATLVSLEGLFFQRFGFVDTGTLLLVMDQYYQLTGDEPWLRKAAPIMIRMCDWIINKRNEARAAKEKNAVCYGLIVSNVGTDNPVAEYSYVTDASLCVGMEASARSLRAVGMTEDAARIQEESDAYRQDIERSMRRSVTEHDGMKVLPLMPESHMFLKRAAYVPGGKEIADPGHGYSGHGYYSLFGSILLETKFLPASHECFRLIPELMERRDGLLMGMCAFGGPGGIDHAFTYGYWMNCLERNEVERVLLGFYGSMAYGMSRRTWAGVELTNIFTGSNSLTLPHLRSGTQQLRLLRNMLVREEGDRLILAQAVPQHWLADGEQVAVLDAPTQFGKVSYTIDSHVARGSIFVTLDPPPVRTPPKAIVLHLRHPEGARIKSVSVDGKPTHRFRDGAITLEGIVQPVRIEVQYRDMML